MSDVEARVERALQVARDATESDKSEAVWETVVGDAQMTLEQFKRMNVDATHAMKRQMFRGVADALFERCPGLIRTEMEDGKIIFRLVLTYERPGK